MQQQITSEFIKSCLLTPTDYKNTRLIKQAISENQEQIFDTICNTIKEVLIPDHNRNQYPPMAKLLAMRLSKELIDIFNMKFVQKFEVYSLESLRYYAEFGGPTNDVNRGTNLFGENMEKDIRQIGMSLVRLALECIHAWAQFFPQTPLGGSTNFIKLYVEIKNKGYQFPQWTYYKEEFVNNHQNNQFLHEVDLLQSSQQQVKAQFLDTVKTQQQPIKVANPSNFQSSNNNNPIVQTPINQTPGNPRVNCVQKSKLVIDRCKKLLDEVGDICQINYDIDSQMFEQQKDEAIAKNEEMDILVNELIDYDNEDLAAEVMLEMDNLAALEKDLNELNKQNQQQFRKKYLKNKRDIAAEQHFQNLEYQKQLEQQKKQQQEAEAKRIRELQQQQEEQEKKRQEQLNIQKKREEEEEKKRKEQLEKIKRLEEEQKERQRQQERLKQQEEEERQKKQQEDLFEKQRKEEEIKFLKQKDEQEQKEKEQIEKEQKEKEQREKEHKEKEQREKEQRDKEQREKEYREKEQREKEQREKEQREKEYREKEQREKEYREKEQREKQQREKEQRDKEQREKEQRDKEQREKEYREKQQREKEQRDKEQREKEQERIFKQQQEEFSKNNLEELQQKIIEDQYGNYQQNQISLNDQFKAQELVGTSNINVQTSKFSQPLDGSQIQNRIRKPISQSSQGRNLQPQQLKIKGDLSGAPDMIRENQPQINQLDKSQLDLLQQQVENLLRDKQQMQKQLEEAEKKNQQLQEDVYSINGGGNRLQEDLKNLQKRFDLQQQEKKLIQNQLTQTKQQFEEYKINAERMKQQQRDSSDLELNNYKIERQQLFSEKQALIRQLDQLKQQSTNHFELQDKQAQNEQLIAQQKREIENLKQEKLLIQQRQQEEIDQNRLLLQEQQSFQETLNKQLNIYKTQLEKSSQDYLNLQENQKKQGEQLLQQVTDARKESLNSKQQLNTIQLQLSDKEAENKQLQQNYQALRKENEQLKRNLETAQQQIDQFIQKNMDNRSSTLLQQKLQQKLDEIDKLKEDHKIAMREKDDYYKQRLEDVTQERQKLQKDVFELQQQVQQLNIAQAEAIQKQTQTKQKVLSKNHSKSQASELESIQQQQNNQQYQQFEISEVKVDATKLQQEVNAGFNNQRIFQAPQQCPIAVFKNFPANQKFYPEELPQKSKNVNPECLELIFPYNSPEDYFNNKPPKQRKGKVIQSTQNIDEISHLNQENIDNFKQRCLGSKGILFEENGLQFGLSYQTQGSQSKPFFTYGLYIINNQEVKYDFVIQFMEFEKLQQFWAKPLGISKTLDGDSNDLIEIAVGQNKIPLQILILQVSHSQNHPFQVYIPNHICQQIIYREIKVNEFKSKWNQYQSNLIRTPLLILNKGVMKSYKNFEKHIPKLIKLNSNKINDFELGIDEIKFGGLGNFQDISFLIKFEILPNDKICIYLTFESKFNSKRQILEKILNGYAQILGDGKSL